MAKAALDRFSTSMAVELTPKGIAVNALRPGAVKTEMATKELGEDYDWSGWSGPEAVVPAVTWLAGQRGKGSPGGWWTQPRSGPLGRSPVQGLPGPRRAPG